MRRVRAKPSHASAVGGKTHLALEKLVDEMRVQLPRGVGLFVLARVAEGPVKRSFYWTNLKDNQLKAVLADALMQALQGNIDGTHRETEDV